MNRIDAMRMQAGFTLVEVVIISLIICIVITGVIYGILSANALNYAAGQRYAATGLCLESIELMHSVDYAQVNPTVFTNETVRITHLGGSRRVPLMGTRSCTNDFAELASPQRKKVSVVVAWNYHGKVLRQRVNAVIYPKQ